MAEPYWDPFDIEIDSDPYDTWKQMRNEAPVYRNDHHDFWALSRYDDIEAAHVDHRTFSSRYGTVLELMSGRPMDTAMLLFLDPPDHTRLRALVSRAFTPRRITRLEDHIRDLCRTLLEPWVPGESFDYVEDFGARLPAMVIAELLGVPATDRPRVHELIDLTFHHDPDQGMVNHTSLSARIELHEYLADQIRLRRTTPRDDMMTDLVTAELEDVDGTVRRLTDSEATDFAILIVAAGTETVARLLGWSAILLDQHPVQRADLAADPSLIPSAVEELLRYEAPSPVQGRWTTRPVELHGTTIPEASRVLLLTGSAGRDERVYPDADRFDVHRRPERHLSLGYGVHFCLGASLARLEGRIGIEETLAHHPEWTVERDNAVRLHTSTVRGWVKVPVTA